MTEVQEVKHYHPKSRSEREIHEEISVLISSSEKADVLTRAEAERLVKQLNIIGSKVFDQDRQLVFQLKLNGKTIRINNDWKIISIYEEDRRTDAMNVIKPGYTKLVTFFDQPLKFYFNTSEMPDPYFKYVNKDVVDNNLIQLFKEAEEKPYPNWVSYGVELYEYVKSFDTTEPSSQIQQPSTTRDWRSGSSEDKAVLLASLYKAVNIPCRFAIFENIHNEQRLILQIKSEHSSEHKTTELIENYYQNEHNQEVSARDFSEHIQDPTGNLHRHLSFKHEQPGYDSDRSEYWYTADTADTAKNLGNSDYDFSFGEEIEHQYIHL